VVLEEAAQGLLGVPVPGEVLVQVGLVDAELARELDDRQAQAPRRRSIRTS